MVSLISFLNRLLPFATPGTPLVQDLLHLAALCALFYYGPQIQEHVTRRHVHGEPHRDVGVDAPPQQANEEQHGREETPQAAVLDTDQGRIPADQDHMRVPVDGEARDVQGDAGPARQRVVQDQRNVGAKKAKALARKDQRRAYNEFMRSQGDAQRAKDAEGADEREHALAMERERRRAAEAVYEAKRAKERQERKQKEDLSRQEEIRRRELATNIVREEIESRGCCDLFRVAQQIGDDLDDEWVEQVLKGSGLLGKKGDKLTFVSTVGWAVRVAAADMTAVYKTALEENSRDGEDGVSSENLARILDEQIRL